MTDDDDVFAAAGLTKAPPSHWTPITRTQDFEAQQKATRARLADTYEPGQSERQMMNAANDVQTVSGWGPYSVSLHFDASAYRKAIDDLFQDLLYGGNRPPKPEPAYEPWHMTWWDEPKWAGVKTTPKPRKPNFDEMTPRARALALKNDRARIKGIEGTKKARTGGTK